MAYPYLSTAFDGLIVVHIDSVGAVPRLPCFVLDYSCGCYATYECPRRLSHTAAAKSLSPVTQRTLNPTRLAQGTTNCR